VAEEADKEWRTGSWSNGSWGAKSSKAEAGIVLTTWNEKKLGSKLAAFNKYAHSWNGKNTIDGEMDFNEFHQMLNAVEGDPDWAEKPDAPEPPQDLKSASSISTWLKKHFGYPNHFWNSKHADRVAKEFTQKTRKPEDVQVLASFAKLDTSKDGVLTVVEAHPYLPIDPKGKYQAYEWDTTARIENTDFASLGFGSHLTNDVLTLSDSQKAFSKAEWESLHLKDKLTDFVKRSKLPAYRGEQQQSLESQLRFHQIATAFPSTKDPNKRFLKQTINDEEVAIHIPTIDDVAGQKKRLELDMEDIQRWLKHEKGMTNSSWLKWTGFQQYASDMARDVLRWGNGSIPGNEANTRIQGHKAGEDDEWTDVAPRLAIFVVLDTDSDGQVDFSKVHPYLTPREESLFEASLFQDESSGLPAQLDETDVVELDEDHQDVPSVKSVGTAVVGVQKLAKAKSMQDLHTDTSSMNSLGTAILGAQKLQKAKSMSDMSTAED
jgi:hypothetical protein